LTPSQNDAWDWKQESAVERKGINEDEGFFSHCCLSESGLPRLNKKSASNKSRGAQFIMDEVDDD
jgi:hypothetical protein